MKYEDIIQAKTQLIELNATIGLWVGGALLPTALLVVGLCWIKLKQDKYADKALLISGIILGLMVALFAAVFVGAAIYDLHTAEIQAAADAANYNLVEIKK
jgi:hypothetical protein